MTTLQKDALMQAQIILMDSVRGIASDETISPNLLLARAEAFDEAADAIARHFKSVSIGLRRNYNSLQPINQLPRELLTQIFGWCINVTYPDDDRRDATQLHRICAVCHHWKELAEGTPTVWCYVTGLDPLPHIEKALKLSEPMSITVVYHHDEGSPYPESTFTAAVNSHAARWNRASMDYLDLDKDPQAWEWSDLPQLHTVDMTSRSSTYTRAPVLLGGGRTLPSVRVVNLFEIPLRWDERQLPGLRVLSLSGDQITRAIPTTSHLLQLLMGTPELEQLVLSELGILSDDRAPSMLVRLARLELLQLRVVPLNAIQQVLSSIQLPQLGKHCTGHDRHRQLHTEEESTKAAQIVQVRQSGSTFDMLRLGDLQVILTTPIFGLLVSPTPGVNIEECWETVLQNFAAVLAASAGVRAEMEMRDGLSAPVIATVVDKLDRFPSIKSVRMVRSQASSRVGSGRAFLAFIQLLGRFEDRADNNVWHLPNLEIVSIDARSPPLSRLAEVCRERRQAAEASGHPKAIRELHISPLSAWSINSHIEVHPTVEEKLDKLQDALGEGQL
ncbi:hypothetical protein FRC01_007032, partial [Tulasnella sp. 417]